MDIEASLRDALSSSSVVVCVGNRLRADDAVGPHIADLLIDAGLERVLDAGNALENYLGPISDMRPDTVLLIDAVHLSGNPGDCALLTEREVAGAPIHTTHDIPLGMLMGYLSESTKARILLLAVQPREVGFGESMTDEVANTANALSSMLVSILSDSRQMI